MDLVLVPGNGKVNKEWIEQISENMADIFDSTNVLYYRHWETDKPYIDIEHELTVLAKIVEPLTDYVIFAKSVGTVLTVNAIKQGLISPKKCIFLGVPIPWSRERSFDVDNWFNGFDTPTLYIQNTNDPLLSYSDLRDFLNESEVKNFELVESQGNTHDYPDIDFIKHLVLEFLE